MIQIKDQYKDIYEIDETKLTKKLRQDCNVKFVFEDGTKKIFTFKSKEDAKRQSRKFDIKKKPKKGNIEKKKYIQTQEAKMEASLKQKLLRKANKEYVYGIKSKAGCKHCGMNNPICLDFHHRNPKEKENIITRLLACNREKLDAEIIKCDVVCANCHRLIHAGVIKCL